MRFSVPQFIEIEDKIFGPLTLKQALYIAGAAGVALAAYTRLGFMWAILLGTPVGILAFALAFVKVNDRPFVSTFYAAVFYYIKNKLYLWKKGEKHAPHERVRAPETTTRPVAPHLTQSRLRTLAWSLDTKEDGVNDNTR